ncbi:MAG: type II secretion system protein GspM [Burkholderiales bacterium]
MNDLLKRYAERIDNATLRERVMLFAAAALVLVFVVNAILIKPLRDSQRRLSSDIARNEGELRTIQSEVQRMARARGGDPDARNRDRAAALRAEMAALDEQVADEQRRFTTPQRMRDVLEEMLQRDKRLRLIDLKTLPVTDMAASQGQAGRRVFRHGVELTLAGGYLDLHAYLSALEGLPTQLYWGRAEMSVAEYPVATLKLIVYTLSFDQAWLVV